MGRYINENDVYGLLGERGMATVHCSQIDDLPRADVASRAEVVEDIIKKVERIIANEIHKCETVRQKMTERNDRCYWEGGANSLRQVSYWIADLKKKYTQKKG